MPGFLLHIGATAMCPHGGQVQVVPSGPRVLVGGQPVATLANAYPIVGCAFMVGTKPQPCVKVQWIVPAMRVIVGGSPAILQSSTGLCQSPEQIPQGPPSVVMTQLRARGT